MSAESAADFFANLGSNKPQQSAPQAVKKEQQPVLTAEQKPEDALMVAETISRNQNWNAGSEALIKKSLMVGNIQYAAEVALKCGRTAEAFLIAQAGGDEVVQSI